jgi:G6PDH family F420-dependent oxidoreductase
LPDRLPRIVVSGFGPKATDLAARIGDGYATTSPDRDLLSRYRDGGGRGDASGAVKVCWGPDREACVELAHRLWRTSGVPGELSQELRTPAHFAQASELVTLDSVADHVPCGPEVEPILKAVGEFVDAGFDRVYLNQIGSDQQGFFRFYREELAPALTNLG